MKRSQVLLLSLSLTISASGCSKLMGDVRNDFDDSAAYENSEPPVRGGRWAERGFLEESVPGGAFRGERYGTVGHTERSPASQQSYATSDSERSWVTPQHAEANRRDTYRRIASADPQAPSTQNTPVYEPTPKQTYYKNGLRATRADFIDDSQTEGSLWASDGQTNYYLSKNRVRGVGDILSIIIEEDLVKDVTHEVKRSLTPADKQVEIGIAQEKLNAKFYAAKSAKERAEARDPASVPAKPAEQTEGVVPKEDPVLPAASMADVDIAGAVELKSGETMLAEILERYPNGNFRIRGTKRVRYKNGAPRLVTLVGIARANDISEEDVLNSGKLYEYRLEAVQ